MDSSSEDHEISELITNAEAILSAYNPKAILSAGDEGKAPRRPLFVEFSGTPKSGKSTCIDIVQHFFRRIGFKVLAPTEGAARRTPGYLKDDWLAFNVWSASYALTQILEGQHNPAQFHIAILDRGLFDALAWFQLLVNRQEITLDDCTRVQEFLLIGKWKDVVDGVFLFQADSETSMARETADKLIDAPGRAMNPSFLEELNKAYKTVNQEHGARFSNVIDIDTSHSSKTTPKSTAMGVAQKIVDMMTKRLDQ